MAFEKTLMALTMSGNLFRVLRSRTQKGKEYVFIKEPVKLAIHGSKLGHVGRIFNSTLAVPVHPDRLLMNDTAGKFPFVRIFKPSLAAYELQCRLVYSGGRGILLSEYNDT